MIGVTENFRKIQDLLAEAAVRANRPVDSVRLLAVSKTKPVEAVLEAVAAGQHDFGENFAQEGIDKMSEVARDDLTWHFIGRLQSNKTKAVAENFDWVHTIDRLKIAERLSRQRPADKPDLDICIQVNVDREAGKSGIMLDDLEPLARGVAALPRIRLRGLMCLPAIREDPGEQREPFAILRRASESLQESGLDLDTLSMGMTADYEAAIAEGATIVRIGTALFGKRE